MALTEPVDPKLRAGVLTALATQALAPAFESIIKHPFRKIEPLLIQGSIEALMRAAAVIGSRDPNVFEVIQGMDGETLGIQVGGLGLCGTLAFYHDRVVFERGAKNEITTMLCFESVDLIRNIILNRTDALKAYQSGRIHYSGESALFVMFGYLLLRLSDYIGFHPWL